MSVVARRFHDRAGNNLFQYAHARAYAERIGAELQTDPWWGQQVFGLTEKPIARELPKRADMEFEVWDGEKDIEITGWCLHQKCLLYSRAEAKAWLKFTPEIREALGDVGDAHIAIHLRWGDFKEMADFIAISINSYEQAIATRFPDAEYRTVCSWSPIRNHRLELMGFDWLPDFYELMCAIHLFRANSTFSWWAAVLGDNHRVFSPDLNGIKPLAGRFQDVPFVEGNHCAISCVHSNCSDLYLRET